MTDTRPGCEENAFDDVMVRLAPARDLAMLLHARETNGEWSKYAGRCSAVSLSESPLRPPEEVEVLSPVATTPCTPELERADWRPGTHRDLSSDSEPGARHRSRRVLYVERETGSASGWKPIGTLQPATVSVQHSLAWFYPRFSNSRRG